MATVNYARKCAEIYECWNQVEIYCSVFPMEGRLLREICWGGKIIKKGNSKNVSSNDQIANIYN